MYRGGGIVGTWTADACSQCGRRRSGECGASERNGSFRKVDSVARSRAPEDSAERRRGGREEGSEGQGREPEIAAKVDSDGGTKKRKRGESSKVALSSSSSSSLLPLLTLQSISKERTRTGERRAIRGGRNAEGTEGRRRHDILGKHPLSLSLFPHLSRRPPLVGGRAGAVFRPRHGRHHPV